MKIRWIKRIAWIALILADIFIYLFLGSLLMVYDDFYEHSKGEYGSWESMSTFDKEVVFALNLWNVVNVIMVVYVVYKVYKQFVLRKTQASENKGG